MEFKRLRAAVAILIACIASFATCENASANDAGFHANEAIQKELKDFCNVKNEQERRRQFETLQELSDGHGDLVPQLVLNQANVDCKIHKRTRKPPAFPV